MNRKARHVAIIQRIGTLLALVLLAVVAQAQQFGPVQGPLDADPAGAGLNSSRRPQIAFTSDAKTHLVWEDRRGQDRWGVYYRRGDSNGSSWPTFAPVRFQAQYHARSPVVDASGSVVAIAWREIDFAAGEVVYVAASIDSGVTWSSPVPLGFIPISKYVGVPAIAVRATGEVLVAWTQQDFAQLLPSGQIIQTDRPYLTCLQAGSGTLAITDTKLLESTPFVHLSIAESPQIVRCTGGAYVIGWRSTRGTTTATTITGQFLLYTTRAVVASGIATLTSPLVLSSPTGSTTSFDLVGDEGLNVLATWSDRNKDILASHSTDGGATFPTAAEKLDTKTGTLTPFGRSLSTDTLNSFPVGAFVQGDNGLAAVVVWRSRLDLPIQTSLPTFDAFRVARIDPIGGQWSEDLGNPIGIANTDSYLDIHALAANGSKLGFVFVAGEYPYNGLEPLNPVVQDANYTTVVPPPPPAFTPWSYPRVAVSVSLDAGKTWIYNLYASEQQLVPLGGSSPQRLARCGHPAIGFPANNAIVLAWDDRRHSVAISDPETQSALFSSPARGAPEPYVRVLVP